MKKKISLSHLMFSHDFSFEIWLEKKPTRTLNSTRANESFRNITLNLISVTSEMCWMFAFNFRIWNLPLPRHASSTRHLSVTLKHRRIKKSLYFSECTHRGKINLISLHEHRERYHRNLTEKSKIVGFIRFFFQVIKIEEFFFSNLSSFNLPQEHVN